MHFHLRRRRQPILLNERLQRAATRHREGATAGQEREEAMSDRFRPLPPVLWRRDHPRAALRHLSLNANEMRKIFSNICITLNPDNTLPIKESAIILSTADNNPGYPRRTSKTTPTSPSPTTTTSCANARRSPSTSMSTCSPTRTMTMSATSTPGDGRPAAVFETEDRHSSWHF